MNIIPLYHFDKMSFSTKFRLNISTTISLNVCANSVQDFHQSFLELWWQWLLNGILIECPTSKLLVEVKAISAQSVDLHATIAIQRSLNFDMDTSFKTYEQGHFNEVKIKNKKMFFFFFYFIYGFFDGKVRE